VSEFGQSQAAAIGSHRDTASGPWLSWQKVGVYSERMMTSRRTAKKQSVGKFNVGFLLRGKGRQTSRHDLSNSTMESRLALSNVQAQIRGIDRLQMWKSLDSIASRIRKQCRRKQAETLFWAFHVLQLLLGFPERYATMFGDRLRMFMGPMTFRSGGISGFTIRE